MSSMNQRVCTWHVYLQERPLASVHARSTFGFGRPGITVAAAMAAEVGESTVLAE